MAESALVISRLTAWHQLGSWRKRLSPTQPLTKLALVYAAIWHPINPPGMGRGSVKDAWGRCSPRLVSHLATVSYSPNLNETSSASATDYDNRFSFQSLLALSFCGSPFHRPTSRLLFLGAPYGDDASVVFMYNSSPYDQAGA